MNIIIAREDNNNSQEWESMLTMYENVKNDYYKLP